jgi:hypothetical protein
MRAAIAAFVDSIEGEAYAVICERYRVDPGAIFDDDVEAFLMRQALILKAPKAKTEVTDIFDEWAAAR